MPAVRPVTVGDDEPMEATVGLPLVQTPPPVVLFNVVDEPTHNTGEPVIFAGVAFTVIVVAMEQDPPRVYIMEAVPALTPVTAPEVELTDT